MEAQLISVLKNESDDHRMSRLGALKALGVRRSKASLQALSQAINGLTKKGIVEKIGGHSICLVRDYGSLIGNAADELSSMQLTTLLTILEKDGADSTQFKDAIQNVVDSGTSIEILEDQFATAAAYWTDAELTALTEQFNKHIRTAMTNAQKTQSGQRHPVVGGNIWPACFSNTETITGQLYQWVWGGEEKVEITEKKQSVTEKKQRVQNLIIKSEKKEALFEMEVGGSGICGPKSLQAICMDRTFDGNEAIEKFRLENGYTAIVSEIDESVEHGKVKDLEVIDLINFATGRLGIDVVVWTCGKQEDYVPLLMSSLDPVWGNYNSGFSQFCMIVNVNGGHWRPVGIPPPQNGLGELDPSQKRNWQWVFKYKPEEKQQKEEKRDELTEFALQIEQALALDGDEELVSQANRLQSKDFGLNDVQDAKDAKQYLIGLLANRFTNKDEMDGFLLKRSALFKNVISLSVKTGYGQEPELARFVSNIFKNQHYSNFETEVWPDYQAAKSKSVDAKNAVIDKFLNRFTKSNEDSVSEVRARLIQEYGPPSRYSDGWTEYVDKKRLLEGMNTRRSNFEESVQPAVAILGYGRLTEFFNPQWKTETSKENWYHHWANDFMFNKIKEKGDFPGVGFGSFVHRNNSGVHLSVSSLDSGDETARSKHRFGEMQDMIKLILMESGIVNVGWSKRSAKIQVEPVQNQFDFVFFLDHGQEMTWTVQRAEQKQMMLEKLVDSLKIGGRLFVAADGLETLNFPNAKTQTCSFEKDGKQIQMKVIEIERNEKKKKTKAKSINKKKTTTKKIIMIKTENKTGKENTQKNSRTTEHQKKKKQNRKQ
jgi:hypothetical protein